MKYIFIDIDGVLNPDILRSGGFEVVEQGYKLKLHKVYGAWLSDLATRTGSELVWGTTWEHLANDAVGRHLELPRLPHLDLSRRKLSETMEPVKARAALEYSDGGPFVYFDDWPLQYFLKGTRGLHIQVNPEFGLMKRHIIEAEKWLNS